MATNRRGEKLWPFGQPLSLGAEHEDRTLQLESKIGTPEYVLCYGRYGKMNRGIEQSMIYISRVKRPVGQKTDRIMMNFDQG